MDPEPASTGLSVVREYYLAHPEQARAVLRVWEQLHRAPIPVRLLLADPNLPPATRVRVEEAARNAPGRWRPETARAQLAERKRLMAAAILVEVAGAQEALGPASAMYFLGRKRRAPCGPSRT